MLIKTSGDHDIILLGATGSGKTYLACALGMAAARRFYVVKYIWLPDLLVEFQMVILQSGVRNEAKKLKYSLPNRIHYNLRQLIIERLQYIPGK